MRLARYQVRRNRRLQVILTRRTTMSFPQLLFPSRSPLIQVTDLNTFTMRRHVIRMRHHHPAKLRRLRNFTIILNTSRRRISLIISIMTLRVTLINNTNNNRCILTARINRTLSPTIINNRRLTFSVSGTMKGHRLLLPLDHRTNQPALRVSHTILRRQSTNLQNRRIMFRLRLKRHRLLLRALSGLTYRICQMPRQLAQIVARMKGQC